MREIRLQLGQGIAGWVAQAHGSVRTSPTPTKTRASIPRSTRAPAFTPPRWPPCRSSTSRAAVGRVAGAQPSRRRLHRRRRRPARGHRGADGATPSRTRSLAQHLLDQNQGARAAPASAPSVAAPSSICSISSSRRPRASATSMSCSTPSWSAPASGCAPTPARCCCSIGDTGKLFFRGSSASAQRRARGCRSIPARASSAGWRNTVSRVIVNRPRTIRGTASRSPQGRLPAHALLARAPRLGPQVIGAVEVREPAAAHHRCRRLRPRRPEGADGHRRPGRPRRHPHPTSARRASTPSASPSSAACSPASPTTCAIR